MTGMELLLAGTAMSVAGAMSAASAQKDAAKFNEAVAENNAILSRQNAASEVERQRRLTQKRLGSIRASTGASGFTQEGTPLDILGDVAMESELYSQMAYYEGEVKASGYESTAELNRNRARTVQRQGYMQAGTALLYGASAMAKLGGASTKPKAPPKQVWT